MLASNTLTRYRNAVQKILEGMDEARGLELIIASQGGPATMFTEAHFVDAHADIDEAQLIGAVISRTAIEELLAAGGNAHYTNLNKMRA